MIPACELVNWCSLPAGHLTPCWHFADDRPTIVDAVVYRHACECHTANRTPAEGEQDEHRFDVNGAPFPYLITEDGATFTRHGSGCYLVAVTILPVHPVTKEFLSFEHRSHTTPILGGEPFPWMLTGPAVYTIDEHGDAMLALTFIARAVDTDGDIAETD